MKNYSVIYKTNSGKIREHETNSLKLAYAMYNETIEDGEFQWIEIADHRNAEIIEYVEEEEIKLPIYLDDLLG